MAKKANPQNVAADMSPPNFRQAVQKLRGIKTKKEKIAGVNGEIADIYAKVEGHKVNKKAGRIFMVLDVLEGPDRADVLRSLNGLMDAAGWDEESADLVDAAENNVVRARFGTTRDGNEAAEEELEKLESESRADEGAQAGASGNRFLDEARRHLGTGDEPYTGDNSDLAGEDDDTGR